ncbi:MAG TPA: hypothetical protein PKM35_05025 [Holophaga sp.]|nr:hypothetical protein [Holophaga sp.]HPS67647.1 hypothetical protein [Holophaga sp.]
MPEAESRIDSGSGFREEALAVERAFAIRVAYDGIRSAFLSALAADSVICEEGPVPGRAAYEALPVDHQGTVIWEISMDAVAGDGTLACMAGPYRQLDGAGAEIATGAYFSAWKRGSSRGRFELALDFWSRGAASPAGDLPWIRQEDAGSAGRAMKPFLQACLKEGRTPPVAGALRIGPAVPEDGLAPGGFFQSGSGELGVLWGSRLRNDGSRGAFALLLASGEPQPRPLLFIGA